MKCNHGPDCLGGGGGGGGVSVQYTCIVHKQLPPSVLYALFAQFSVQSHNYRYRIRPLNKGCLVHSTEGHCLEEILVTL